MATNILDRYGIKEVADVTFYELSSSGQPTNPVLYLDTLKVSTIEQTAEEAEARGGKGNPPLIIWDYGKEITVTLEDALFSAKSMAIMFGNGKVKNYANNIMRTEQFTATKAGQVSTLVTIAQETSIATVTQDFGWSAKYEAPDGKIYNKLAPKFYSDSEIDGAEVKSFELGKTYFCTYDLKVSGAVIEISANSFPGTYYVTGDTYARSEASGKDEFFQFIIPKAKVQSENTITLEAEGDPSVFNMNLRVMRPADGQMMKLVKYSLEEELPAGNSQVDAVIVHNHDLVDETAGE